jgi:hypothetical protein
MMNETAIRNIHRILNDVIAKGENVIALVSIDPVGHLNLNWRTNDPERAKMWEDALTQGVRSGVAGTELKHINEPQ